MALQFPLLMNKIDICREYRLKYPDFPNLKLARIIYKDNSIIFSTIDEARGYVRKLEGQNGSKNKKGYKDKTLYRDEPRPLNPYKIPETHKEDREPFVLPLACNNILLISDLHIPYHDPAAIETAVDYGKRECVNTVFINGDLIDMHQVSRFEKDPRKRSIKQEFDAAKEFLKWLRYELPNAEIYWLKGNHCIRWEHFIRTKVREIWDDDYFYLEERLRLNEERVHLLDDKILVKAGKLSITHGHHIFKGVFSPVNPSRGAFLRAKQSLIVGHLHRASHHPEVDLDGKVISCWSTGCLCELKPDYSPLVSNSQHGFAHILVEANGDYTVKNYQIINGKLH